FRDTGKGGLLECHSAERRSALARRSYAHCSSPHCSYPYCSYQCPLFPSVVLFVGDLFHPVDHLTVELFLDGDVRHGCGRRSPMPVLLAGREPDHITRPNFFDRASPALCPAAASGDDQSLT